MNRPSYRIQPIARSFAVIGAAMSLVLLAGCTRGAAQGAATGQQKVSATSERITIAKGSVENRIIATGRVAARSVVSASFSQAGTIAELSVKEGDAVKAGQVLAALDTTDLKLTAAQRYQSYISAQSAYSQSLKGPTAAELASANAALSSAQAAYKDLFKNPDAAQLADAQSALSNAEVTLKRAQELYNGAYSRNPAGIGASPEAASLETATNDYNSAKAKYDALFNKPTNKALASAAAQIQSAQANIAALTPLSETVAQKKAQADQAYWTWQAAEENVKATVITAPVDGIVTKLNSDAGEYIGPGATVMELADFSVPIFEIDVDEADLGNIKIGQDARVLLQTYPDTTIPAKVESISTVGTNTGTIVTYKVKLALGKVASGANPEVLINMSGTSEVVTAMAADVVVAPNRVLIVDSATKAYSVQRVNAESMIDVVPVKLGFRDANQAQIVSGLNAGDVVVVPSQAVKGPNGQPQ